MVDTSVPWTGSDQPVFGYLPSNDRQGLVLARNPSRLRVVVVDGVVADLYDGVRDVRRVADSQTELPQGLYWFEGLEGGGSLLMVVSGGELPGTSSVVPLNELGDEDPLMSAWQWAEHYWDDASPISAPMFEVDEEVVVVAFDQDGRVIGRDHAGEWMYTISVGSKRQRFAESSLRPRPIDDDPTSWVLQQPSPADRFSATLTRAKLEGGFRNTLFSFRSTRTTFRPYQFKPILKMLETGKARILIADEVGLGKTIEAGLLWTELDARGDADRVLIVTPASLVEKWMGEMRERFDFELTRLDVKGLAEFARRHHDNQLPRRACYIVSLETFRTWDGLNDLRDFPPSFDLVIVDEAHSMRNQDTKNFALGSELSDWADNMVFLTATPINLKEGDLLSLLELLAPEDVGDLDDLLSRLEPNRILNKVMADSRRKGVNGRELAQKLRGLGDTPQGAALVTHPNYAQVLTLLDKDTLAPPDVVEARALLASLNTMSTVITRTKKIDVDDRKARRTEIRIEVHWSPAEKHFYSKYLDWCDDRAKEANSALHFAMQMPLRLASACLPMARQAVLDPESFTETTADGPGTSTAPNLAPDSELVAAAKALSANHDSKFDDLLTTLESLHKQDRQALLFTHSRKALSYLQARLANRYRVAALHGGVDPAARLDVMADFRAGAYDLVLANRVASEGLDFEFCSAVINYDLPWNPMEIEQRIGRIDRIGQNEEKILVVNFYNDDTIDGRILRRLLDRITIFEDAIGPLEPILAENASNALKAGFDFTLTMEERDQKLYDALGAIEEQRRGLAEVADSSGDLLISDDVDVAGLEDDLVRTGRYVGQRELALLIDDWAKTDHAEGLSLIGDGRRAQFRGNPDMARRVGDSCRDSGRITSQATRVITELRHEAPIPLVLDQELARTRGGSLLTATHPLSIAAASVPGHRQARFASVVIDTVSEASGVFVVLLAKATSSSGGGNEIWGSAVTVGGRPAGDGPVHALLAALAEGELRDTPCPTIDMIDVLVERASRNLDKHQIEQRNIRKIGFDAKQKARLVTIEGQYQRRVETIQRRIDTARSRRRADRVIALFESQLRRAESNFTALMDELSSVTPPDIALEPLAACVVTIRHPKVAP